MSVASPDLVHPSAIVEEGAEVGTGTRVWHHVHIRAGAIVGENCVLGKGVFIDAAAVVGAGCKIQNNVSVYSGVTLEDSVFVGPSAVFTNDLHPRATATEWETIETTVRRGASIGANATIVCGITLGAWSLVAAGAVVTRDVLDHELVAGVPARRFGWVCQCGHTLERTDGAYSGKPCGSCGRSIASAGDARTAGLPE